MSKESIGKVNNYPQRRPNKIKQPKVGEYGQIIIPQKEIIPKNLFETNIDGQTLFLHTKERKVEIENEVLHFRNALMKKIKRLKQQWWYLDIKELEFRTVIRKFSDFVKSNSIKRERFLNNYDYYNKLNQKYDEKISEVKEKIDKLNLIQKTMFSEINKHVIYYEYLNDVIPSTEYKTISEFMNQYELLLETVEESSKTYSERKIELDELIKHIKKTVTEKLTTVRKLTNKISSRMPLYSLLLHETLEKEKQLLEVKCETNQLKSNLATSIEFIDQLFRDICKKTKTNPIYKKGDIENQLIIIRRNLMMIKKVKQKFSELYDSEDEQD